MISQMQLSLSILLGAVLLVFTVFAAKKRKVGWSLTAFFIGTYLALPVESSKVLSVPGLADELSEYFQGDVGAKINGALALVSFIAISWVSAWAYGPITLGLFLLIRKASHKTLAPPATEYEAHLKSRDRKLIIGMVAIRAVLWVLSSFQKPIS